MDQSASLRGAGETLLSSELAYHRNKRGSPSGIRRRSIGRGEIYERTTPEALVASDQQESRRHYK